MTAFSYSLCLSILHSFWQAGLLYACYFLFEKIYAHAQPLHKRNFLFGLLTVQLVVFGITFYYCWNEVISHSFNYDAYNSTLLLSIPSQLEYFTPWIMFGYVLTLVYKISTSLLSWKSLTGTFGKDLQKPSIDLKLFCQQKAMHLGIKKNVQIWLTNHITTPVTYGFLKPMLLLPAALITKLSPAQVEALILHELNHIKANDYLLNWVMIVIENIFFFNPFVRILCNNIRLEREKACDIQVIHFNYSPIAYAEALLEVKKYQQQQQLSFQLAAVGPGKQFLKRVQYFTNKNLKINYAPKYYRTLQLTAVAIFLLIISLAFNFLAINIGPIANNPTQAWTLPLFKNYHLMDAESESPIFRDIKPVFAVNDNPPAKNMARTAKVRTVTVKVKSTPVTKSREIVLKDKNDEVTSSISAIPVAFADPNNKEEKEIIIQEECSGTDKKVIKSYKISNINGEWVLEPNWIASSDNMPSDNSNPSADSTSANAQSRLAEQ